MRKASPEFVLRGIVGYARGFRLGGSNAAGSGNTIVARYEATISQHCGMTLK